MLRDAPVAPLLASLSNTQLLQYFEFIANIRMQEKEEVATLTFTSRD